MPPFDPVRDAINSPVTAFQSPISRTDLSLLSSPLASLTMSRRATDLSVLLNTEDAEGGQSGGSRPSSSSKRSNWTEILHSEKLDSSRPFQRSAQQRNVEIETGSPYSQKWSSPSTSVKALPATLTASPSATSRPSSSSSSSNLQPQSTWTPRTTVSPTASPSTLPYNPTKRKTPAGSVLIPLTKEEIEQFKAYRGQGTAHLTKRKRAASTDGDDHRPTKRLASDVAVVVDHYNSRPEIDKVQRQDSPIIGLKNFNNWVKSVLISKIAHPILYKTLPVSGPGKIKGRGKVLDMGCGKGGDISKWAKAKVAELIGADIADVSIEQARQRWESLRNGPRFDALFVALDCYSQSLATAVPKERLVKPFDVVSMQFCMHYAFETEAKTRCMLQNVSQWLRPGGVFIGTIPNAEQLLEQLDAVPPDAEELSFGNSVYKIRFDQREPRPIYGHRYWFFLKDAVEDVPEYLVHWDNFVQLASQYRLYPTFKKEFHDIFEAYQDDKEFGPLMVRMKVVDQNGESAMDEDQWEAANIYIAFAFEKQ